MTRKIRTNMIRYIVLLVLTVACLIPIVTIVLTATKSRADFFSGLGLFELPQQLYWANFTTALFDANILQYMWNSLLISIVKVPIGILVAALAAFAITRLKIRFPRGFLIYFLIGMMVPFQVALVPLNGFFANHGLINSFWAVTYVYIAFGLPFAILVLLDPPIPGKYLA